VTEIPEHLLKRSKDRQQSGATPSTDAFSMLFLWIPMSLLYELGIFMCKVSPSRPDYGIDVPDPDEMVGV